MWINNSEERGDFYKRNFKRLYSFPEKRNFGLVRMSFEIINSLFENCKYVDDSFDILFIFCVYI